MLSPGRIAMPVGVGGGGGGGGATVVAEAIDASDETHVIVRPVSTVPAASLSVAEAWAVLVMTADGALIETLTDATAAGAVAGAVIVRAAVPVFPSDTAVMVALPDLSAL